MTDQWVERVRAITTLAKPPLCQDGEVRCARCVLPSGAAPFLNRTDTHCYWCGGDELVLVGEALRTWYRVPTPPPPRPPEEKPEPPLPGGLIFAPTSLCGCSTCVGRIGIAAPKPGLLERIAKAIVAGVTAWYDRP